MLKRLMALLVMLAILAVMDAIAHTCTRQCKLAKLILRMACGHSKDRSWSALALLEVLKKVDSVALSADGNTLWLAELRITAMSGASWVYTSQKLTMSGCSKDRS